MKISAKAEYACLAAIALARQGPDEPPLRIREISEAHDIPERYLVQILLQLKGSGLVVSTRGALGGYRLGRPADSISLGEILAAIDGPESQGREPGEPAARALAVVWQLVRAAERSVLDQISLAKLASQIAPREWVI
jgi:Rrf2 family cysteine metabolism transcriptional repressor